MDNLHHAIWLSHTTQLMEDKSVRNAKKKKVTFCMARQMEMAPNHKEKSLQVLADGNVGNNRYEM
jgi:hypothetical protein